MLTPNTSVQGPEGMRAVSIQGNGRLSRVRVIHLAAQNLFWFEVKSAAAHSTNETSKTAIASKRATPQWARTTKPLVPEEALRYMATKQQRDDAISEGSQAVDATTNEGSTVGLSKKAKLWQERF